MAFIGSEIGRNKLEKVIRLTSPVVPIECPFREAYGVIDDLQKRALDADVDMVVISAGVTATCLAARLSPHIQAIDLGSIGGFMAKMLHNEPIHPDDLENTAKL